MADSHVPITAGSGTSIDTRTETDSGNHRQVVVLGDPATTAGVAPVNATAGLKVDLGADNDVTVTGTVTANAGTGTMAVSNAGLTELAGAIDTEVQVDVVGALPAGNNNIGDVDVASSALPTGASTSAKQDTQITAEQAIQTAVELLDDTVRAEDVASGDGHKGVVMMAVRQDTPANTSATDGDYEMPKMSAGRMWVDASGKTLTVDGSGVTQPVSHAALTELAAAIDTEVQVDVVGALPTGDNNIGNVDLASAIPAGTNNIGDVDVLTVPSDPFGANADAAATAGGTGTIQAKLRNLTSTNDSIKTAVEILDNAISGSEMQVDVVGALPAGTNAIGKLAANSGVDIGDTDVTSVIPGSGPTNLGKAEDGAHSSGDVGVMDLGVRNDTMADFSGADNDYTPKSVTGKGQILTASAPRGRKVFQTTTITSSTAETTVLTAAASTFHDVYGIIVTNTSAVATEVAFKDDTAGTTRFTIAVPAGDTRGFMLPVDGAWTAGATNDNWTATCADSVASILISVFAVKHL